MGSEGLNKEEEREGGFDRYLLEVEKLFLCFKKEDGTAKALKEVSLKIKEGEILALVGESGCGKSVFCKTVLGFLPDRAEVEGGSIRFLGEEILPYEEKRMEEFRRTFLSLVMQNPAEALNPSIKAGKQIEEAYLAAEAGRGKSRKNRRERREEVLALMRQAGIPQSEERYHQYPYQLSGGMCQRVGIAIALAKKPRLLLADEPTSALDVTVQAQILQLLQTLREKENLSILLVTHDLGVVAAAADRVAVMYQGEIVECEETQKLFQAPAHPYTRELLQSHPAFGHLNRQGAEGI